MTKLHPTNIQLVEATQCLRISWNDDVAHDISIARLRKACPCATCREKRNATVDPVPGELPVLSIEETRPLRIVDVRPVGNYAYGIHFSDGHDTGIFTLEFLRELGDT